MRNVSTSVAVGLWPNITVVHEPRSVIVAAERSGLILESADENDVLTTVSVGAGAEQVTVRVHWSTAASGDFQVLFVPETNFLHVGGGQVSGAIDLAKRLVATQETPVLFWGFARVDRYVVEYGELECLLYDLEGHLLGRAPVDPPYEVHHVEGAIRFESIVAGSTWLNFPSASDEPAET